MRTDLIRTHFSTLAEQGVWASLYEGRTKVTSENWSFLIRARRVIELLESTGRELREVLDIGCGTAPIAASLVAMGSHYTGVDFSPQMIEAARQDIEAFITRGDARLRVGDATSLTFPDDSFDVVIAMGLVEYLTANDLPQCLREIRRVLSPGGVAVITIPKRWHWGSVILRLLYPLTKAIRWRRHRKRLNQEEFRRLQLTPGELDRACGEVGLRKTSDRHYNVQLLCHPATRVAPRFCYLVNRPFEGLARVPGCSFLATGYIGLYRRDEAKV